MGIKGYGDEEEEEAKEALRCGGDDGLEGQGWREDLRQLGCGCVYVENLSGKTA